MEDANLIACLYPHKKSHGARFAISNPQNISRFVLRLLQEPELLLGRESRESIAPLEENKNEPPAYFYEDGLQLTFSHGPKGDKGFALGINQNQCDIVLPKLGEIKKLHGYFTFDDENRFIWRDSSTRGTIVTYDGKGGERRRKFTWILGGDKVPDKKTEEIVIELHEHLKFQIVVCKHEMHLDQYIDNIKRFRAETAVQDEPRIGILGMHSPGSTAPHSNAHTPNQGRIVLKQRTLGKGAFAVVTHSWDVSTGIEYACKKPRDRERFDTGSWEKEIDIMSKIRHDHIVQLCHWDKTPLPCLYLEYLPFGSIEYQHRKRHISYEESLTILHQSLSALEYLHGRKKPIVHRDIKPENILVLTRDPLHIKLSDFGLAKADGSLTTFCGTETYCPPEIAKYFGLSKSIPKDKYTEAVDIWSLGVVILKFALPNLPYPGSGVGIDWCEKIIDEVNNYDDDLIDFLSTTMLVMRPESRYSAQACLDRVEALFIPSRGGSLTPTPASYANEYEIMTAGYHVEERLAEEQLISSCDTDSRLRSSVIRKYIKSNASPPDFQTSTSTETRKRPTRPLTLSSSPTRRSSKRRAKNTSSSKRPQEDGVRMPRLSKREQPAQSSMDHLPGGGGRQKSGPGLCGRSQLLKRQRMVRSHIVASNLQEEPPGYITMNVEGRAVQMRKSDCWLNATQILLLAGKNVNDLRSIYDTLRRYARWQLRQDTIEGILHNQFWVCYHVGKRLSEVLDVSNALGPLLEYGRKTAAPLNEKDDKLDPISRYFEKIRSINARKGILSIRLQDLWVNADHICREAEIDWSSFKRRKEYKADHYDYVMSGPRASWGHYTNPLNALRLCVMLHLEQLELLLRATLEEHGYQYESGSKAVPHTNVPAICEKEPTIELDVQDTLSWVWPDYENAETVTAPLSKLGSPFVNGDRHQNSEEGPTAAKSPPYIPEWDGLFLPPFRSWESESRSVS